MNDGAGALNLLRLTVALFIVLSLILTFVAISVGVPYRVGGIGEIENVGADSFLRGTGLSAPIVFLIAFAVLLALTWLPTPWRAVPVFMIVVAAVVSSSPGRRRFRWGAGPSPTTSVC
ncbi:MAG TPA: hypothetical protein VHK28_01505 [Candidatus Limnocylindria bacterium]|nr:hypothetical protein [Candidatus Limnocylindria bacterium]